MKRVLVAAVTVLLFATAAVKAGPSMLTFGDRNAANVAETAQFHRKGKGKRFRRGFKRGFKKGGGGKGAGCFNRCVSKGALAQRCANRCR
jgi:hypothetical protein